jgi:hypothetical protein
LGGLGGGRTFGRVRIALALTLVVLLLAAPATAGAKGPILYVGDSLGVGTVSQWRGSVDDDTEVGRSSTEGLSVLHSKLRRRHRIVIFDLGTNDYSPAVLLRNLRLARRWSGDRLMIVFTMNKPGVGPFNEVVRTFARSTDNVVLIDWHSTAARGHLLAGDGIHSGPYGYRLRAALVSKRLRRAAQRL